jgi:hypothetical protein
MVFLERSRRLGLTFLVAGLAFIGVSAGRGPLSTPAARAAAPAVPSVGCSWAGESDQRDVNIGAPDLDAFYWLAAIPETAGTKAVISGSYPHARYFSLTLYNDQTLPIDSIYDQQIDPDSGSANPFRGPVAASNADGYHVTVEFSAAPSHPAANTLYAGTPGGSNPVALLELRVYVPQTVSSPQGSVPFPQITLETTAGTPILARGACSVTPPSFGAPLWEEYAQASSPPGSAAPPSTPGAPPTWERTFGSQFGNPQNAYLVADVSHSSGQLLVIHTRAPTFPNTGAGQAVYGHYQLRYWSICTYDSSGQAAIGCAADYRAAISGGWITYVVSDVADRPANATSAKGVTWLPWGPSSSIQVVYRNMLPAPWYRYAAEAITAPSQSAQQLMGPYYPTAGYCSVATFERGGWQACVPGTGSTRSASSKSATHRKRKRRSAAGTRSRNRHGRAGRKHRHARRRRHRAARPRRHGHVTRSKQPGRVTRS